MGGKKVTTGYWYELAWHDGLCLGPLDAYLEFRPGTKTAWSGRAVASQAVSIYAPELWGGEKDQGGVAGTMALMFGEPGQVPNSYLTSVFGGQTSAWRGVATVAWEGGKYGANNPYAQKRAHKVERIKMGWDDGCWYPAKAAVPMSGSGYTGFEDLSWSLPSESGLSVVTDEFTLSGDGASTVSVTLSLSGRIEYRPYNDNVHVVDPMSPHIITASSAGVSSHASHNIYKIEINHPAQTYYVNYKPEDQWTTGALDFSGQVLTVEIASDATVRVVADPVDGYQDGPAPQYIDIEVIGINGVAWFAKNPAHMLLWAHTQEHCGGQPIETVNMASLTAAADWFYAQGFGLCTIRYPDKESASEFSDRIARVAGAAWTQNRGDGQWYLDIANGEYDIDALPILTDDDIVSFEEIPTVLDDAVNSVSVKYMDPQRKEMITTPPQRAMALVSEFGTIHQTFDFPEIPTDALANRVAQRELLARCTPTRVFTLATTRKTAGWRRNTYFRLQVPKRGIADMVCLLAEINSGSLKSGAVQIKATQDIYSLPSTVYTETETGIDTRPPSEPIANTAERVLEVPYIDAVAAMTPAEFSALPAGTGFVAGVAANPGGMRDFTLYADAGGGYQRRTDGLYCPTAILDDAIPGGQTIGIPITDAVRLSNVEIGSLCLVGDELCRVDAIDATALLVSLGRGCADTLPKSHDAGTRIYFHGRDFGAADTTQYIDGESINVKLPSNTGSKQLALADAAAHPITFANRLARPYPPANFRVNGVSIYSVGTPSPGGGGSGGGGGTGGGGGGTVPPAPPPVSPSGTPASPTPGPNGGYPDDAPYPVPSPPAGAGDVMPDGDFTDPASIADWTLRSTGGPLGPEFSLVGGKLQFRGAANGANSIIVCEKAKYSLGFNPLPRYRITVRATVSSEPGLLIAIGVTGIGDNLSTPAEYVTETTIEHVIEYERTATGVTGNGILTHDDVTPMIYLANDGSSTMMATIDDVQIEFEAIAVPVTALTPAHLDFDAGLTGWTCMPVAAGITPNVTVSSGTLTAETVGSGVFQYIVCDDPLDLTASAGKYLQVNAECWCDDPTVSQGVTTGGIRLGMMAKVGGVYNGYPLTNNLWQRGDFTPRTAWIQLPGDSPGITWHLMIGTRAQLGYKCKVRNISVNVTDAVID